MNTVVILFLCAWALIAYTYTVFPLLVLALSSSAGREPEFADTPEELLPAVTILVAAHNEEDFIAAKIRNTWQLDYPQDRITLLIGSDGSSDDTPSLLRAATDPRLHAEIFSQRRGKVSVVNDLMAQAPTEIVVLSDANTMLAPDSVRRLVRHFQDPGVGCVNGALSIEHGGGVSGEGLYWKYELWIKRHESRLGFVIGCYGGILAVRRDLYRPLPTSTIVEDFVLTMAIMEKGHTVRFDPEARATEPASASSHDEWERKVRIGAGDFQALALTKHMLHPRYGLRAFAFWSHKVLRWFVPFLMLGALAANVAVVAHGGPGPRFALFAVLLAMQAAAVLLSALVFRLPSGAGTPGWLRPISYFYLMNYALFCGFFRWARGGQPVTWRQAARQTSGGSGMSAAPVTPEYPGETPAAIRPLTLRGNFAWTTVGNITYSLCSWLMLTVIAKIGDPAMVGQFALGLAVTQPVIAFSQLSLSQVQATDARREYRFGDYLGLRLVTTALALLALAGIAGGGGYGHVTAAVIVVTAVGVAFDTLGDVVFGLLRQHERMDRIAISMGLLGVLSLGLLTAGLVLGHSVVWAAAGSALASAIVALGYDLPNAVLVLRASGRDSRGLVTALRGLTLPKPEWDPRVLGRLAWLALPLGTIMLLIALNNNIVRYFVGHYLGLRELGVFSVLVSFVTVGRLLTSALGLSAGPRLARHYADGDRAAFLALVRRLLLVGTAVGLAAPLVALVAGRPLLTFFYTPEYARHQQAFVLYLAAGGLGYVAGAVGWAITAARSFKVQAVALAGVTLFTVASSAWLVPSLGLRGAALSALLVSGAQLAVNLWILRNVVRVMPDPEPVMVPTGRERTLQMDRAALCQQPAHPTGWAGPSRVPSVRGQIMRDFRRYRAEGVRLAAHVLLFCPGFHATRVHRQMHAFQSRRWPRPIRLVVNQIAHGVSEWTGMRTRICLPAQAVIGPGLYVPHFGPVTVNPDVRMGENCTLHQGVTIGQAGRGERRGTPTLGDRVYVGANAVIIGRITVGDDAVIGAGAVVTKSIPARGVVVGNPARLVSLGGSFDLVRYDGMEADPRRQAALGDGQSIAHGSQDVLGGPERENERPSISTRRHRAKNETP